MSKYIEVNTNNMIIQDKIVLDNSH